MKTANKMIKQLVDYLHFKENYKVIAINLSKQQAFHENPEEILQTNFTGNLNWAGKTTMFLVLGEGKKLIYIFDKVL